MKGKLSLWLVRPYNLSTWMYMKGDVSFMRVIASYMEKIDEAIAYAEKRSMLLPIIGMKH